MMSPAQKQAWFNLAVIGLTVITIAGLSPLIAYRAWGGFGLLALQAAGMMFFRRRGGWVQSDERDALIARQSMVAAYSLFWVVFCLVAALGAPAIFGDSVPTQVVQLSVVVAWMLVSFVQSVVTLVAYGRGGGDAAC